MCGIAGFIDFNGRFQSVDEARSSLYSMISKLDHRGPDDKGYDIINLDGTLIGLAQSRLSIIDLTANGHQPMNYENLVIIFNGEVYNYSEIRQELEELGHTFIGSSDTEVIVHAYKEWAGDAVKKFIGMYVFLIVDLNTYKVSVFSDRAGVKPFFYYWKDNLLLFASELKAFVNHPFFNKEINKEAVVQYFLNINRGYVPAPLTIYNNTFKLKQGSRLTLDLKLKHLENDCYWSIYDYYYKPKVKYDYETAKAELERLLISACEYRMIADVPVGVFLSGGYDSTLVASLIQSRRVNKLKTFTIGFEQGNDESVFSKKIAEFLGTEHTSLLCTTKEAQEIIPQLSYYYDEPFADSSAIPTILVSRLASQSVKVALSADGGDELFGGYNSYSVAAKYSNLYDRMPNILRSVLLYLRANNKFFQSSRHLNILESLEGATVSNKRYLLYREMQAMPSSILKNVFMDDGLFRNPYNWYSGRWENFADDNEIPLAMDYESYLPNDILTKVDRASMSVSIEAREPLLDHRLAEFAAQLPWDYKFNKTGKYIIKDIVHKYIPSELVDRPKVGFSVPISNWLQNDLSFLIDEYMTPQRLNETGLLNGDYLFHHITQFRKDKFYFKPFIWKLLMFQMWFAKWMR